MLPLILLLAVPTSTAAGGYVMWSTGQELILKQQQCLKSPPSQSIPTYATGLLTLIGTYRLHYPLFRYFDEMSAGGGSTTADKPPSSSTSSSVTSSSASSSSASSSSASAQKTKSRILANGYIPPKSFAELFTRGGGATIARMGAVGVGFFAAGALQTYASCVLRDNSKKR